MEDRNPMSQGRLGIAAVVIALIGALFVTAVPAMAQDALICRKRDKQGDKSNNHVNLAQSTNDVYPTALRLAMMLTFPALAESMDHLITTLRADAAPKGEAWLSVGCGAGCTARVPLAPALAKLPAGEWKRVGVPLKCLSAAGADVIMAVRNRAKGESAVAGTVSTASAEISFVRWARTVGSPPVRRMPSTPKRSTQMRATRAISS